MHNDRLSGVVDRSRLDEAVGAPVLTGRVDRVRARLGDAGADALLVTTPENIRWLTGFTGSAGLLLVTAGGAVLTTDGRYRTQAAEQLADAGVADAVDLAIGGVEAQLTVLGTALVGHARLGLESGNVTWSAMRSWAARWPEVELVPTDGVVTELRMVKDGWEIDRMVRAAAIADAALASVTDLLTGDRDTGTTELAVAAALDHAMRELGAEDRAFETIVASGPNAAKPHARPTGRRIEVGDPVVVDFGAMFDGYRSDMTRTFSVGRPPEGEMARVFEVVAASQRAGVASVRPGERAGEIDRVCRDVIAEAGWADRFEHGTGHGVGLDIHEAPSVGPGSTANLSPGVVVTVEPGVYLAGLGGVRIEDTLVVTADGSRTLTEFPKEVVL
ncbi:MAG: Xaa-Pro peptidase family protein [Actinomycetota bacterium]|nr:Xaa-Pro peptidase family protein [Actinomycetota bacterium]